MRQHEPDPNSPSGARRCVICGAPLDNGYAYTCLDRPTPGGVLMPEPTRREYASEAYGAIGERVAELERERLATQAEFAEAPVPVADEMDWLCG